MREMRENTDQTDGSGHPISPLKLPFCETIPALSDGILICIKGQLWPNTKKVTIQLLQSLDDVAFSLEFICDEDMTSVIRSCLVKGKLKKRDNDIFDSAPKRCEVFEILLLVTTTVFKCSINGCHMFDFPIYLRLDSKAELKIFGHCDVARISYQMPRAIPTKRSLTSPLMPEKSANHIQFPVFFPLHLAGQPSSQLPPIGFLTSYSPIQNSLSSFGDPFQSTSGGILEKLPFPGGIPTDAMIHLYASTIPTSKWFKVVFKTSNLTSDFSFAIYVNLEKGHVIRNDSLGGVMGAPETSIPYFPFAPGQPFNILFKCLPNMYKMAVNARHFLEFAHRRAGLGQVCSVHVEGDLFVSHFFVDK